MSWWCRCRFIDSPKLPLFMFDKKGLPLDKAAQEQEETQLLLFLCGVYLPVLGMDVMIESCVGNVKVVRVHGWGHGLQGYTWCAPNA
jgi:hypothetical protein